MKEGHGNWVLGNELGLGWVEGGGQHSRWKQQYVQKHEGVRGDDTFNIVQYLTRNLVQILGKNSRLEIQTQKVNEYV